jgi:hypothetical protein
MRKRVAAWQTHNTHLVNFDVPTLRVIWFCSGALLGCLLGQHLMLRKHSPGAKVEMVRLDRASSEPLHQQLYRQIREELESGSFDSSASR